MKSRIGHGYDIHRLVAGRDLFLGGIKIPHDKGLLGHSDADVALHAACDAMLGAAGLMDIGHFFPPTDISFKDISSLKLLAQVRLEVAKLGWSVSNIDITIVAEEPRIFPFVDQMKKVIAETLSISVQQVGIKATTNEGVGAIGKAEAICAYAVCLLSADSD